MTGGTALVTGAAGFVGRHLVAGLRAAGWQVAALTRGDADLTDPAALTRAVRAAEPDVAFHLAAARVRGTAAERATTLAVNATSGALLVEALPARCRAVVRLGSSTEYAPSALPLTESSPLSSASWFGATKAAGSLLLAAAARERGLRAVVLRAFQVYGPGDSPGRLVPTAVRAARTGEVLPLTGPGQRRDWVEVGDVVRACLLAAAADALPGGTVVNVGTGVGTANEELVGLLAEVAGRPVRTAVGAHPGRDWDTPTWTCDPSGAERLLGWRASVGLREGLARVWAADGLPGG